MRDKRHPFFRAKNDVVVPEPSQLEVIFETFLRRVANARTLTDVNIAAGLTRQELRDARA